MGSDVGPQRNDGGAAAKRGQRGVSAVEFALLAPAFFMLFLGMIDLGRAFYATHVLLEAAQAGARKAALPSTTNADVDTAVSTAMGGTGMTLASKTYSNVGSAGTRGTTSTVTLTYNFATLSGRFIPGWTGTKTLTQASSIRHE